MTMSNIREILVTHVLPCVLLLWTQPWQVDKAKVIS